jgi:hypothetical protein
MDRQQVADWIADNLLDSDIWDRASEHKQTVAVRQAERNLSRWYPDAKLTVEIVAYQAVWELYGVDPVLRYQRHNVRSMMDAGELVTYANGERPVIAPDVTSILGTPTGGNEGGRQYGGALI